jgi:hypothetical protein
MSKVIRLTSVYGAFPAHVLAARLEFEGFDVQLRGALNSPYGITVGEMARVDVYVPEDQIAEASLILLVEEVDEVLDLDYLPRRRRYAPWVAATAAILLGYCALDVLSR